MKELISNLFNQPNRIDMVKKELESNQRAILTHQSSANYHNKMIEYCQENIQRLSKYLEKQ